MLARKPLSIKWLLSSAALLSVGMGWLLFVGGEWATAQSGSGSGTRSAPTGDNRPFEVRFWDYLKQVHYRNWAPGPGQGADFYPGQSPHGARLKVYLNRTAAAEPDRVPVGSIIIKENYSEDAQLMAVTIMYRSKDYDAEHNDWYWVKYLPDGRVDRTPPEQGSRPIAGKFQSCIECHSGAGGNDFVFVNDGD